MSYLKYKKIYQQHKNDFNFRSQVQLAHPVQSGVATVYMTFWVWCAMQSAPERPGAVEVAFLLRGGEDEDDLVGLRCYASPHREDIQPCSRGISIHASN